MTERAKKPPAGSESAEIARQLGNIAVHLKYLGNGDAATTVGAIENLALQLKEAIESHADGLHAVADAIKELAQAVSDRES